MKTRHRFIAVLAAGQIGACVSARFNEVDCPAGQTRNAQGQCLGGLMGMGGGGGEGGGGGSGAAGAGGTSVSVPTLQTPTERVGLHRARSTEVPVTLSAPTAVDLSVTIDGLPPYLGVDALTIRAGASDGVLVLRATNEAPLGVPSILRLDAKSGGRPRARRSMYGCRESRARLTKASAPVA